MYQPATPPPVVPHAGRTALTYGASLGIGLGILQSVLIFGPMSRLYLSFGFFLIPLSLLLWIVGFMLAGVFAAKRFGKISTGTLAGLWAGLVGGIITGIAMFASLMSSLSRDYDYGYHYSGVMAAGYLTGIIFLILLMLGVGTGLGALGGLIGQSFSGNRLAMQVQAQYHPNNAPRYEQAEYRQTDPLHQEQRWSDPPQPEQ